MAKRPDKNFRYTGPRAAASWLGLGKGGAPADGLAAGPAIESRMDVDTMPGATYADAPEMAVATPTALQPPPTRKLSGFWDHTLNVLSKGQHGADINRSNASLQQAAYQAQLQQALQGQAQSAGMEKEIFARDSMMKQMEEAKKLEAANYQEKSKAEIAAAMAAEAFKRGVRPELWDTSVQPTALAEMAGKRAGYDAVAPLYGSPEYIKAKQDEALAAAYKGGVENDATRATTRKTEAETQGLQAALPTKRFMDVGSNAKVDPTTREVIQNLPSLQYEPAEGFKGGVVNTQLGGPRLVKKPGGVLGEFGGEAESLTPAAIDAIDGGALEGGGDVIARAPAYSPDSPGIGMSATPYGPPSPYIAPHKALFRDLRKLLGY